MRMTRPASNLEAHCSIHLNQYNLLNQVIIEYSFSHSVIYNSQIHVLTFIKQMYISMYQPI